MVEINLAFSTLKEDRRKMKQALVLLAICAMLAALASSAFAADPIVIKIKPEDDYVYLRDRLGSDNYTETNVNASPNSATYFYDNYGFGTMVTYRYTGMTFDISSLPTEFTSAVFSFHLLSSDCGYGTEVGSGKLMHGSTELLRVSTQPLGWISVDVTSQLLADRIAGNTSTFIMERVSGGGYGSCGMSFSSGESGEFAPMLTVTPVPEPSSLLALASGGMALCGFAARRRRA